MKAVWNAPVGLTIMHWAAMSNIVTTGMFTLLFIPFLSLGDYVWGWPLGLSISVSIVGFVIRSFAKRDLQVSISIVPGGFVFLDEAPGYERRDFIRYDDVQSVRVRNNILFKTLVITLKEGNQQFSLSNVVLSQEFLEVIRTHAAAN
ncbi:hypothetical protein BI292_21550 [Pseudomonas sp. 43NM1]|uniref:hypothetical protein n=1 Tax=Pseudomonas sp. 43NM1 TaxID=1904755 RepID=UPI000C32E629|nr:hypothetical protein [Pseudomonas sp. 43NM1]PKH13371.1 hypothetical protein BI292_21550 [Pseudomonas sp. 43NM1]